MLVEHNLSQQQQRLTGVNFQQTRLCVRRVVQADFVNPALGRNAAPFQYCVKRLAQIRLQQVAVRQRETVRFQHHRDAVCRPHALNLHHAVIRQFQFALGALIRVGQLRVNQPRAGGNALHPAALVEAVDVPQVAA